MKNFIFRKHGDNLLFALALAVLITALIYSLNRRPAGQDAALTSIVFNHWWQEDIGGDTLRNLITEFERQHEGISIILNERSYEDLRVDLFDPAGFAAPGDVLALDPLWVPELLKRDVIENAGAPILSFINVLYYNIEILREAGFTRPPRTRSEFLTFARAVAANGENRALSLGSSRGMYDDVFPWIWAAGTPLIRDGNPLVTSAPVVQSLAFLASLNNEGLISPDAFFADSRKKLEDFISGRTAFMIGPTRYIAFIRERMGDEAFSITSVPMLDNQTGRPFFASAGWTVGVHSASAHREEAGLFAAFLAGRASFLSENARGALLAYNAPETQMGRPSPPDPFYSKVWEISLVGEVAKDFSELAGKHELEEIFREELSALFAGTSSPAQAAAAIQERWLAVLRS